MIKNNVFNSLEDAHIFYSISETILNKEMEANSKILLEKYAEDKNPENWNLVELQKKMPDYKIYIINQNLETGMKSFLIFIKIKGKISQITSRYIMLFFGYHKFLLCI